MPIPAKHIIQRQTVWMDQPPAIPAFVLQERLSAYCRNTLPGVLESVFDGVADADTVIRLDTLDIDVGTILPARFEEQLTQRIRQRAEQELNRLLNTREPGDTRVERHSRTDRLEQQFWFFLHHGYLPAWADTEAIAQFSDWLTGPSAGSFRSELRSVLPGNSSIARRLVSHSSDVTLMSLVSPTASAEVSGKLRHLFQAIHQQIRPLSPSIIREQYWLSRFRAVSTGGSAESYLTDFYESLYRLNVAMDGQKKAAIFFITSLQGIESGTVTMHPPDRKAYIKTLQQLINQAKKYNAKTEKKTGWATVTPTDPDAGQPAQPNAANESRSNELSIDNEANTTEVAANQRTQSSPPTGPVPNPPMYTDSLESLEANGRKSTQPSAKQQRLESPLPDAEIYVSMAGIVLLHPFLTTLFAEMGLIHNKLWVSPEASEKGVQVLAWLATGTEFCPEYTLPLLKLLCGLPLETVVSPDNCLTDTEKLLTTEVLEAVLTHWEVLKNTSIAGLQEAFLQREGKLTAVDGGWRLAVERKTIDILLDKLPWGVSMIKLPWMPDLLFVDWI